MHNTTFNSQNAPKMSFSGANYAMTGPNKQYKTPPKRIQKKAGQPIVGQQVVNRENVQKCKSTSFISAATPHSQGTSHQKPILKETHNRNQTTLVTSVSQMQQKTTFEAEQSNDVPESPCQLSITPQENRVADPSTQSSEYLITQVSQNTLSKTSQIAPQSTKARSKSRGKDRFSLNPRGVGDSPGGNSPNRFQQKLEQFEQKLATDHLKSALCALNEKLKFYENVEMERDQVTTQLEQADLARTELRSNIKETAERIRDEKEKNAKYQTILINENESLSKQILQITEMFSKKVAEFDSINQDLGQKQKDLSDLELLFQNSEGYRELYEQEYQESKEVREKFNTASQEIQAKSFEYKKNVDSLTSEKNQLILQNQQLISENEKLKSEAVKLQSLVAQGKAELEQAWSKKQACEATIEMLQQKLKFLQGVSEENLLLEGKVDQLCKERERLHKQIQDNISANQETNKQMKEEFEKLQSEREQLNIEFSELLQEKTDKDIIIKTLTSENLELTSRVTALEQLLCAKEDSDSRCDEFQDTLKKVAQNKEKYKNDLEICTNYLLEVEEKCQEAQKTSLELLSQLKEREVQIDQLQQTIFYLQQNSYANVFIYQPVRDDPIDKRLSEYINNAPVSIRNQMNFVREQEGIYKYGKKRVFMKIEGDQIIIRVGGGYLTIEEFLEQYSDNSEDQQRKLYGLIYGGACQGSRDFKTFYFTQKTVENSKGQMIANFERDTANSEDFSEENQDTVGELKSSRLEGLHSSTKKCD